MTDFSSLQAKVNDLKAKVEQNSITPSYLGSILDDFIGKMKAIDMTDYSADIAQSIDDAAAALQAARNAVSTSDSAADKAVTALSTANKALSDAAAALSFAAAAKEVTDTKGKPDGLATLDSAGTVPTAQMPEEVYEVLEFDRFLDTLSAAEGASEASAQSASGPSKAAPDLGFQEFKYPVYFVKDIRAFVRQERKLIVGGGHSLIYVKTWSGCERFGTPGDNGVIPVAGKVYIDTSSSLSYRMGEVSETIDGVESHYADLVPLGLRTGKTAGTAFDGAAGQALKGRTQWLEARTGALRVLPFDGEYFDGGAAPTNGIYYHRIAQDDSGEFLCFGQTTFADYGLSEDDYDPNKIPYQLYVCDGELYRVREDTGIMESFTDVAKMAHFIDRWNEAWKIGGVQYGKYDPDNAPDAGHPFQGNGLWMTYEEAIPILELAPFCKLEFGDDSFKNRFRYMGSRGTYNPRTLVPFNLYSVNARVGSADGMFQQWVDANLEVLVFLDSTPPGGVSALFTSYKHTFDRCKNLHTIKGLSLRVVSNSNNTAGMFDGCAKLQNLTASFLNCDVSLKDSPLLTRESIVYLVQYASNTKPITVTVHPDVYAKLTGDTTNAAAAALSTEEATQWQQVVTDAAAKNISFATV